MTKYFRRTDESGQAAIGVLGIVAAVAIVIVLLFGLVGGIKSFGRYQTRQDAMNRVKVSAIEIRNQGQRIKITRQKARIRYEQSVGVREAQDEIARTLTPLYVQFEMVEALKQIARSGKNSSVIYLPSGANGIPLVSTVNPHEVGQPDG